MNIAVSGDNDEGEVGSWVENGFDMPGSTFDPRLTNNSENLCPNISFLEIEIDGKPVKYQAYLEKYFTDF